MRDFPKIIVHEVWVGNDPPKGRAIKRASGLWRFFLMSFLCIFLRGENGRNPKWCTWVMVDDDEEED